MHSLWKMEGTDGAELSCVSAYFIDNLRYIYFFLMEYVSCDECIEKVEGHKLKYGTPFR